MKKIFYISLFLGLFAIDTFAQLKTLPFYFPIGGFEISSLNGRLELPSNGQPGFLTSQTILDSMLNIGFNTFYQADYHGRLDLATMMPSSQMTMYIGLPYYPDAEHPRFFGDELLHNSYVGSRFAVPGKEDRYFLATNLISKYGSEKFDNERFQAIKFLENQQIPVLCDKDDGATSWKEIQGGFSTISPLEWIIPTNKTGDLLNLQLTDPGQKWYNPELYWDTNNPAFRAFGNDKIYVDFIFRYDCPATGDLYTVTADVYNASGNTPISITLDYNKYSTHDIFSTDRDANNGGMNNPRSLFEFPPPFNANTMQRYAVVRLNAVGDDTSSISIAGVSKIIFTLRHAYDNSAVTNNVPIYVRGFRIRSPMADYLLSNRRVDVGTPSAHQYTHMDQELRSSFVDKINGTGIDGLEQTINGVMPKKNISNLAGCGELTEDGFRTFAYVDSMYRRYALQRYGSSFDGPTNILPFLAENVSPAYTLYRAVYEDQTGHPPPIIDAEDNFGKYSKRVRIKDIWNPCDGSYNPNNNVISLDPPYIPRDAILNSIRSSTSPQFTDMGFPLQPKGCLTLAQGYSKYINVMHGQNDRESRLPVELQEF